MLKKGILFLLVLLVVVGTVHASLEIESVKIYVDGARQNDVDQAGGSFDAPPGSEVIVKAVIKNTNPNRDDDIEDIMLTGTIEGIDDGSDLEEESDEFDLDGGNDDDQRVDLVFNIPLEVDADSFNLVLTLEGSFNGSDLTDDVYYTLDVKKENHELRFFRSSVQPSVIHCGGNLFVELGLINTGKSDEDVTLRVSSSKASFNAVEEFTLYEGAYDDDNKIVRSYNIPVDDDVTGSIPINLLATYNDGDDQTLVTLYVNATKCATTTPTKPTQPTTPTTPTGNVVSTPIVVTTQKEAEPVGFFNRYQAAILIIGAEVLAILVVLLLIFAVRRR